MLKALGMNYDVCNFQMNEEKNIHVSAYVERWSRHSKSLTNVESGGEGYIHDHCISSLNFPIWKKWDENSFLKKLDVKE